jgi:cell division septation protein DedD
MGAARSRGRGRPSKRTARLLFGTLCLTLLGTSFGLGVLTGRQWIARAAPVVESSRAGASPGDASAAGGRGDGVIGRRGRSVASEPAYPQIQEKLTFYQTLPAPLGVEKAPVERPSRPDAGAERVPASRPEAKSPEPKPPDKSGPGAGGAYTVQVAAYRSRAQAEALRDALGEGAYVVEATAESGVTFRVRLGAYATRAEAEAAAARVRAERAVTAFITVR